MSKKKTHEEFMKDFMEKNKNAENIEVLGIYVNSHTKIKCRCKLDGYEFEIRPYALLSGQGCRKCAGNIKKTTEQFIQEMKEINDNIEILGEYKSANTKIKCKCKKDNHIWYAIPSDLLNNHGCPKCAGKNKTTESFIQEMKKINDDIEIIGEYIKNNIKIKCRCKIDGNIFETRPSDLLNGSGCPKCNNAYKRTHKEFIQEMKKINPNIEILGEFINVNTKIKCRCRVDGYEWEVRPNDLLSKKVGCPKCSRKATRTTEEFTQEMKKINPNIEILGEYININTKIKCKCKVDNHIWYPTPNSLLSNNAGCPKCSSSKGEKKIAIYLKENNINFIEQYKFKDCKFYKQLPFDFYIPQYNICIEYDGGQHYEIINYFGGLDGFINTKIRDTVKTIYCKENNIKLIRIPYWDFDNIEKILEKEL